MKLLTIKKTLIRGLLVVFASTATGCFENDEKVTEIPSPSLEQLSEDTNTTSSTSVPEVKPSEEVSKTNDSQSKTNETDDERIKLVSIPTLKDEYIMSVKDGEKKVLVNGDETIEVTKENGKIVEKHTDKDGKTTKKYYDEEGKFTKEVKVETVDPQTDDTSKGYGTKETVKPVEDVKEKEAVEYETKIKDNTNVEKKDEIIEKEEKPKETNTENIPVIGEKPEQDYVPKNTEQDDPASPDDEIVQVIEIEDDPIDYTPPTDGLHDRIIFEDGQIVYEYIEEEEMNTENLPIIGSNDIYYTNDIHYANDINYTKKLVYRG